jgi:chaperonin GroES
MLRAVCDKVIVKPKERQAVTSGGIYLPECAQTRPLEATVVSVGTGILNKKGKRIPIEVSVGERVFLHPRMGQLIEYEGEEYISVSAEGILSILPD